MEKTAAPLKAVTLTHVRFQRGDKVGHFLAWISLLPIFISIGGFLSSFIFRRDLQHLFFALGLIISQFINEFVKRFVQQARPDSCTLLEMCDSHGWPSSHSQYMFFFAVYFSLLNHRHGCFLKCLLPWCFAALTMYSRVYLGYHTVAQVVAGAAGGVFLGFIWFRFVDSVLRPNFPAMEETYFGRRFYLKDTSHIPNVLKFEYENSRAARRNLAEKSD